MFLQTSSLLYMILPGSNEVCDSIIRLLCFISNKDQIWWAAWFLNVIEVRKQGQTVPYAATFLDIYSISPPIYTYLYKYIYTHIQIYIHIYLHVLLFNFMTTFSLRMLCLKKPYNMDFFKKFNTKIFIL